MSRKAQANPGGQMEKTTRVDFGVNLLAISAQRNCKGV
jgi:hypothetical protein